MLERPETLTDFKEGPVTEPLCKDEFCTDNGCPNNPLTKRHEISIDGKNYTTEGPVEPIEPAADLSALDVVDKLRERLSLLPDVPYEQDLTLIAVVMKVSRYHDLFFLPLLIGLELIGLNHGY